MSALENQIDDTEEGVLGGASDLDNQMLTFYLGKQIFGIPVRYVRDIFKSTKVTQVPLTPPEIAGVVNLRGHIVTAINLRHKLCLPSALNQDAAKMNIAVDVGEEMYSLIVDSVSEVVEFSKNDFEENPSTLDDKLKELSLGIYKLEGKLLIILDVNKIISPSEKA